MGAEIVDLEERRDRRQQEMRIYMAALGAALVAIASYASGVIGS